MSTTNRKVFTANKVLIKVDGKAIGIGQNARASDDYAPDGASGIGDIHVKEYVPTMARHVVTMSSMQLKKQSLISGGVIPKNGDEALTGKVIDIEFFDDETGKLFRKYTSSTYASGDMEIQKHAIMLTNATFYALDVDGDLTAVE